MTERPWTSEKITFQDREAERHMRIYMSSWDSEETCHKKPKAAKQDNSPAKTPVPACTIVELQPEILLHDYADDYSEVLYCACRWTEG